MAGSDRSRILERSTERTAADPDEQPFASAETNVAAITHGLPLTEGELADRTWLGSWR